jgi:threonine synthase
MAPHVSFGEALLQGLAPDGGLYLPTSIPTISESEMQNLTGMEYHEIAFTILNKFLGNEIEPEVLYSICADVYNFPVPLEKVFDRKYIMRLDQGPTASFKDFAARMMSRLMQYYLSVKNQRLTILTATSGDTGSAVANAFNGLKNINVLILYPSNEVTSIQRKQMTTLKDNINVIAIDGKFDDCQRLVKKAFQDPALSNITLSSANSINIGRLLPQSVYYFYAYSKLASLNDEAFFSVPSGNFGNLMGGLLAREMGLPVKKYIISTNANNEVPEFMRSGIYTLIDPSINCISSAMNVGHPSNMARVVALYGGIMNESGEIVQQPDLGRMRNDLHAISVSDNETRETIREVYRKYKILLEPHGAVAWKGVRDYSESNKLQGKALYISLETAHPGKFEDEMEAVLGIRPVLPPSLTDPGKREENYFSMENRYDFVKDFILMHYK